jgi:hypothetical protein
MLVRAVAMFEAQQHLGSMNQKGARHLSSIAL